VRADFPVRRAKRAVRFVLWSVSNANMRMNGYWEKLFFRDAVKPRSNGPVFSLYHGLSYSPAKRRDFSSRAKRSLILARSSLP
jgi:hypothetical protein